MNWSRPVARLIVAVTLFASLSVRLCGEDKQSQFPGLITDEKKARQLKQSAVAALRESTGLTDENRAVFKDYYVGCVIGGMTSAAAATNGNLFPEYRKALSTALKYTAANDQLHGYFVTTFRTSLASIIEGVDKYSPMARFNAMLALGDLDDREGVKSQGTYQPPVPNAAARKLMVDTYKKTKPDVVHVAALVGLQRHAAAVISAPTLDREAANEISRIMTDVIKQTNPPTGISKEGHYWMKRIAVETLGTMKLGSFVKLLEPIVADESVPMHLRCAAAKSVGQLQYQNVTDLNTLQLAGNLTNVAVKACRLEIDRVKTMTSDDTQNQSREPSRVRLIPGDETEQAIPVDPIVQQTRRQLLHQLGCVRRGLSGAKAASANDKAKEDHVSLLITEIDKVAKLLKDEAPKMLPDELLAKIATSASGLEQIAKVR